MSRPFFSIIVCSRNRPDIVKSCLLSLKNQSFDNYEVIFSDNSDNDIKTMNYNFVKKLACDKIRYVTPSNLLNMHEHYNFALAHAKGLYVGVLTDKNLFINTALQKVHEYLKLNEVDILNYAHEGCTWEPKKLLKWFACPTWSNNNILDFNTQNEIERRLSFSINRMNEGWNYNYGKIFFGFYNKKLIDKIISEHKQLFFGINPDYTSAIMALKHSKKAVFYTKTIMLAVNSYAGNGKLGSTCPNATLNFLRTCTNNIDQLLDSLPIPNIYTVHNMCAYDYLILNRIADGNFILNLENLAKRVAEDLSTFPYSSEEEKDKLHGAFADFNEKHGFSIDIPIPPVNNVLSQGILLRISKLIFNKRKKIESCIDFLKYYLSTHHLLLTTMLKDRS